MKKQDHRASSSLPTSLMISEWVYKFIQLVDGFIRWYKRHILPDLRVAYWCLRW